VCIQRILFFPFCVCLSPLAIAFNLELNNGYFFGPGKAIYNDTGIEGINRFPDAQVRNIILTGPLSGIIPFANNGGAEPNVIAEELVESGVVDGMASDGTLINENADTALRLNYSHPETGESADVMVIAEMSDRPDGGEPISPDSLGNLTFSPSVVADPGDPSLISRFNVVFTTGAAEVPISKKTELGLEGGIDRAGPFHAGKVLVGRLGDYDRDGFLDGILVLAATSPMDLIVARGDPIAQIRPWISDIPVDPGQAAFLTLSGLLNNYPFAFSRAKELADFLSMLEHLENMNEGVVAILGNFRGLISSFPAIEDPTLKRKLITLRNKLAQVQKLIAGASSKIDKLGIRGKNKKYYEVEQRILINIQSIFFKLQEVADDFAELQSFLSVIDNVAIENEK